MRFSAEKIAQIKEHVRSEPFALAYIEHLEKRLEQAQIDGAKAKAELVATDTANTMYGANLNEVFTQFCELPAASQYAFTLYFDGSGMISLQPYDEMMCAWDGIGQAQLRIKQAFHTDGKENGHV